jgi:O-6-methylguanine DNA methyltransferase
MPQSQPHTEFSLFPTLIGRCGIAWGERGIVAVQLLKGLSAFQRRVYEVTRTIGPGQTLSYGEVAALCGDRSAARAVGQALGHNPFPIIVPCHRVLGAGGKSGGFSAPGGVTTKLRLLSLEPAGLFQLAAPQISVATCTTSSSLRR